VNTSAIKSVQGCILFCIPPPERRGKFFQVIWEGFPVVKRCEKKKIGKERGKGNKKEKDKRKKDKKGRKRIKW